MADNTSGLTTSNATSRPLLQTTLSEFANPGKPASTNSVSRKRKRAASTSNRDVRSTKVINEIIRHNARIRDIAKRASQFCARDPDINTRFMAFKAARLARTTEVTEKKKELHTLALSLLNNPTHTLIMGSSQIVEGAASTSRGVKDIEREDRELAELEASDIDDSEGLLAWTKAFCQYDATVKDLLEAVELISTGDIVGNNDEEEEDDNDDDDDDDEAEDSNMQMIQV